MPRAPATTALVGDGRLAIGCDRDDLERTIKLLVRIRVNRSQDHAIQER